ncbi:MAG: FadR family transcriptional regulator [Chloroflexota bacterium]|nr:FadR family transcriptional regulator [Chloroflexota bacterium]
MATKLRRETLPEQLAEQLIQLVADRGLEPGDFLPSAATIADEFAVSRPVVREALRTLEARGLIRTENGRGAIVQPVNSEMLSHYFHRATSVDRRALVELLEVRKGLEVESARLAAIRSTEAELGEIAGVVHRMRKAVGRGRVYAELDANLHLRIAAATHNTTLLHLIESIRGPLKGSIEAGLRSRENAVHLLRVQELHEDLLHALTRRDPEKAASVMTLHFDEAVQHIAGTVGSEPDTERESLP